MSNELITKPNGEIIMPERDSTGVMLSEAEESYPRLIIVQPTSKEGEEGKYYLQITGESFDKLKVVFIENSLGRVMFNPDRTKPMPLCGSDNRILPSNRFTEPKANRCVECPFSRRGYTEPYIADPRKFYQCDETIPVIGFALDLDLPFIFTTKRTANRPMQDILTVLKWRAKRKNGTIADYIVEMTTKEKRDENRYFIPVLKEVGMLEDNEVYKAVFAGIRQHDVQQVIANNAPSMDAEEVL